MKYFIMTKFFKQYYQTNKFANIGIFSLTEANRNSFESMKWKTHKKSQNP